MVQKILTTLGLFILLILPVQANTVKINDLIENAKEFDGQTVMVQAEVIGEVLERGAYAWININDESNAIGVFIPISEAKKIKFLGNYAHTGDTLLIKGILHNACLEHGGELDIHAQTISIVDIGSVTVRPVESLKIYVFCILAFLSAMIGVYFYQVVKSKRVHDEKSEEEIE